MYCSSFSPSRCCISELQTGCSPTSRIFAFQGLLLFGVSYLELTQITTLNLIFILLETIIFKTIAVPVFMNYVIRKNKITRDSEPYLPNFISLIIITSIVIITFILSNAIAASNISKIYFVVALSALFVGLYIIIITRSEENHHSRNGFPDC